LTKVAAMCGRNNLVRIILQGLTIPSKTRPMKKTQKKKRTSIKDVLIGWFKKPKEAKAESTTKAPVTARDKSRSKAEKTVYSKLTAKLKEKLKAESLARAEAEKRLKAEIKAREKAEAILKAESKKRQRLQAPAKEVKVEDEVKSEEKVRACAKEIKDCIELINKSSGSRDGDESTKSIKQGLSPSEMVMLVAKAEKNISEAVIKTKEKVDKKAKRAK